MTVTGRYSSLFRHTAGLCGGTRRPRLGSAAVVLALLMGAVWLPPAAGQEKTSADRVREMTDTWTGDFDGMVERHQIRALVAFSKTFFFLDGKRKRGASYEALKEFEKTVNKQLKKKTVKVEMVFLPVSRDELIPGIVEGRGDIAAANLTITPERQELVDFSEPLFTGVSEIVVSGPGAPTVASVDDLAGQTIHVRKSSSYYASLVLLNEKLKKAGKPDVKLVLADENLEDEDLLEMVNAGLLPMIIMDSHKAKFWAQIFDKITLHPDIAVRTDGQIAWAFRKNSPELKKAVNAFVKENKKGTLMGNIIFKRYLKSAEYVKNSLSDEELKKFEATIEFFQRYAEEYEFDWLMVAALGYQESRLDQSVRSPVGAIGVMQVLPTTAKDPNVGIPNIEEIGPNIHAGTKYLHFLHHRYFQDPEMDELNQWLFTFAAYNAGPAKVRQLRKEAVEMGLDPNVWFRSVELVAAKRIGRETVQYVSNIYKYYIAYGLIAERRDLKEEAKKKAVQ
jgi:membrane-bound lytic murein transglycosylase MltF